jgi:hypothetical protein
MIAFQAQENQGFSGSRNSKEFLGAKVLINLVIMKGAFT